MRTTYPAGVKITTPILTQGGRGNWSIEAADDGFTLTVVHPMAGVEFELVLFGEHADTFARQIAAGHRKARKSRLKAVTA